MPKHLYRLSMAPAVALCISGCILFPSSEDLYGPARSLNWSGEHLYVCAGRSLVILDAAVPGTLEKIGVWTSSDGVNAVAVVGDEAYVAAAQRGLVVLDVSDPRRPREKQVAGTDRFAQKVRVADGKIFVTAEDTEIVFNQRDLSVESTTRAPQRPDLRYAGSYTEGNHRYVTDQMRLYIEDITAPASPVVIASCPLPVTRELAGTSLVYVHAGLAYVVVETAMYEESLAIVDVRNLEDPRALGSCAIGKSVLTLIEDVTAVGDHAYVAAGFAGVHIIDVSDPSSPKITGTFETSTQL